LRVRYDADKVYTYIGEVLISLNPYKQLGIYNTVDMDKYALLLSPRSPPHVPDVM
jgi:myosin-1